MNPIDLRIATLLDADALAPQLHAALPGAAGTRVAAARLHQSRRRISRKTEQDGAPYLELVYALDRQDDDGRLTTHWCSLQACTRGWAADLARRSGGLHLADLDAVLWPLSADPALAQMADFLDPGQVHGAVARGCDGPVDDVATAAAAQVMRYEPRTHVVARFALPRPGRPRVVWGKAYAGDTWRAVAQRLEVLWPYGEQHADAFALARPAGASAALRAVWQDEIVAAPAREALLSPAGLALMDRTAQALGHLQSLPLLGSSRHGPPELQARATKQARKLERAEPALAAPLHTLLGRLARLPGAAPVCNVHGDFHIDQLREADGRLLLFDLDELALGHAAHDIADFASQLLTDDTLPTPARTRLARRFVQSALAAAPQHVATDDLDWHLRVLLLRKAYSFFVRHRAGWLAHVRQALSLSTLGLEALTPGAHELAA